MNSVYDCAESLSNFPMYFKLFVYQNKPPQPEKKLSRYEGVVLNMMDTEESIWFEGGQEISSTSYKSSNSDLKNIDIKALLCI